ncbi:MAG: catalase [Bryobacteraceae bacterium]
MARIHPARFLNDPALQTPVFVRFSTVGGSRGSADTVRDVRGFATKFYTTEGVFDIVGNNIPIFFIQDAIKFPDFVHAVKAEPHNEIPQASSAHDTFWDFVTQEPETTHMVMWLMSPRAIPRSLRTMEGFGVNTFRLVNAQGKSHFIKWHWKPLLGMHSLVWDEAQKLAGKDSDFHKRDLWDAIDRKEYPEFELGVQVIADADEMKFDFDILDATKLWPEELVPVRRIGKMVLNRNPDNFFSETEQVAFCPTHLVPGIDFSNDPLLQGRLFSYLDTQISRIGVNFAQLPINRPTVRVSNDQREGKMQMMVPTGPVSYQPAGIKGCPMHSPDALRGFVSHHEKIDAHKVRARSDSFKDHFSQATLFWNSQTAPEKKQIIEAFVFELTKVKDRDIRKRNIEQFSRVDMQLASGIALGLGEPAPSAPSGVKRESRSSAALSIIANTPKGNIKTMTVAVLATNGVDDRSLDAVRSALKAAGARAEVVSERPGTIRSASGKEIAVDKTLLTTESIMFDAVYIPGGPASVAWLMEQGDAIHFVREAFKHLKAIGAAGDAVKLIQKAELKGVASASALGVILSGSAQEFVAAVDRGTGIEIRTQSRRNGPKSLLLLRG